MIGRVGIDLGGTKIEVIALDERNETLVRHRVPTPVGDYGGTISAIADLVAFAERELGIDVPEFGIGTPGSVSLDTGFIKNANSTVLIGKPLHRDLQSRLQRRVIMTNDANCFALSESVDGAAAGEPVVFGVILGTGTGGGIAVNGHIVDGANRIAGEWGHNPLPWPHADELPGPQCYCGKQGCIETFLSGPGLARDYYGSNGSLATAEQIAQLAERGDDCALQSLQRYEDRLARSLATVINVLDPNVIVLGGGVSNIKRLYQNVPALLPRYVFSDSVRTRLVKAAYGDSSGVRGAAMLVPLP